MAGKSRFAVAETRIRAFFAQNVRKVFTKPQLLSLIEEQRNTWNLGVSTTEERFLSQLVTKGVLSKLELPFEGYVTNKELYAHADATVFQVAAALAPKAYLSHYSGVWLNGLTTQLPKIIYVTFEQSKKPLSNRSLTQAAIAAAFAKPQRRANSQAAYQEYTFLLLNGGFTNRLGVSAVDGVPVTNVERTLLDCTVRPNYAGGVPAVLEAYRTARERVSLNKLVATLDTLAFTYPYFQAVGFYLEKAGYQGKKLEELRARPKEFDFYLTYEMTEMDYSADWKLYFPKGL